MPLPQLREKGDHLPCGCAVQVPAAERGAGQLSRRRLRRHRQRGQGLTDETIAACTSTVRIPMTDRVESLNAGIAGSILLWHFREESL